MRLCQDIDNANTMSPGFFCSRPGNPWHLCNFFNAWVRAHSRTFANFMNLLRVKASLMPKMNQWSTGFLNVIRLSRWLVLKELDCQFIKGQIVTCRAQKLVACEKTPMTTLLFHQMRYGEMYLCINMNINVGRRKDQQLRISPDMRYERGRILLNYKLVLNLVSGPQRSDLGCTAGLW